MASPKSPSGVEDMEVDHSILDSAQRTKLAQHTKDMGNEQYKAGNFHRAVELYTEAIEIAELPKDKATYLSNRAAANMALKRFSVALNDSRQSVKLEPSYTKGYLRGAACHAALGEFEQAISVLKSMPKQSTAVKKEIARISQLRSTVQGVEQLMEAKQYNRALMQLNTLTQQHPDILQLKLLLIQCHNETGRHKRALALCNDLYTRHSDNAKLVLLRGQSLYYTGNQSSAIKHFQQVLQWDPDNRSAVRSFKLIRKLTSAKEQGNKFFKQGKIRDAIEAFTAGLALDPKNKPFNSQLYCNRAAANMKISDYKAALSDCDSAIELNPDYTKAYVRRAQCQLQLEDYEEAVRSFERAHQLDQSNQGIRQQLRDAKLELKKSKRKDYYKILGVDRDADEDDIRRAYRKMALKWHPDKNRGSADVEAKATAMFKDIGEAYGVLSDPQKKRRYDSGADMDDSGGGFPGGGDVDVNDLFRMFFAGGGGSPMGGGFGGMGGMGGGHSHGGMHFRFG